MPLDSALILEMGGQKEEVDGLEIPPSLLLPRNWQGQVAQAMGRPNSAARPPTRSEVLECFLTFFLSPPRQVQQSGKENQHI